MQTVKEPESLVEGLQAGEVPFHLMVNNFLNSTTEHLLSFVTDDVVYDKMFTQGINDSSVFKHSVYEKFFGGMEFRHKATGFEGYEDLDQEVRTKLDDYLHTKLLESIDQDVEVDLIDNVPVRRVNKTLDNLNTYAYTDFVISEKYINHYKKYKAKDFLSVSVQSAKEISEAAKQVDKSVVLLYSGGLDSEFMVRVFMEAGIDFECVTFRMTNGSNEYEMGFVEKFQKQFPQVKITVVDLDFEQLWSSQELFDIAFASKRSSPQILTQLWMAYWVSREMNGFSVSAGECRVDRNIVELNNDNQVIFKQSNDAKIAGMYQWRKGQPSDPGCPTAGANSHWRGFSPCVRELPE